MMKDLIDLEWEILSVKCSNSSNQVQFSFSGWITWPNNECSADKETLLSYCCHSVSVCASRNLENWLNNTILLLQPGFCKKQNKGFCLLNNFIYNLMRLSLLGPTRLCSWTSSVFIVSSPLGVYPEEACSFVSLLFYIIPFQRPSP